MLFATFSTGEEAICRFAAVLGQQQYPNQICVILCIFFEKAVIKIDNHTKVTSIGSTLCCPSVEHLKLVQSNQAVIDVVNSVLVSCGPINLDNYPSGKKKENHRLKRAFPGKGQTVSSQEGYFLDLEWDHRSSKFVPSGSWLSSMSSRQNGRRVLPTTVGSLQSQNDSVFMWPQERCFIEIRWNKSNTGVWGDLGGTSWRGKKVSSYHDLNIRIRLI